MEEVRLMPRRKICFGHNDPEASTCAYCEFREECKEERERNE